MSSSQSLLCLLQLSDSAYPTGSFSHCSGLEAALQHGLVHNDVDFKHYCITVLENTAGKQLPFVIQSHRNNTAINELRKLDELCNTTLINHVERRASIKQGRSFIDTSMKAFSESNTITSLKDSLEDKKIHGHLSISFGCVYCTVGITLYDTCVAFMYGVLKGIIAAAVKLGRFGPLQGQQWQFQLQQYIPEIISRNVTVTVDEVHTSFPLAEIVQCTQDTLFSKLFYS